MDAFAIISVSVAGAVLATFLTGWLWQVVREPIGQAFLAGVLVISLALCSLIGGVWLIGTRLI